MDSRTSSKNRLNQSEARSPRAGLVQGFSGGEQLVVVPEKKGVLESIMRSSVRAEDKDVRVKNF